MWNYENMQVTGKYLGVYPVIGVVELSRVAYGGEVKHTIVLNEPIFVHGSIRERVILNHSEIETVKDYYAV
jgi:hypothetical protein